MYLTYDKSELVIGLVGAVGTDLNKVSEILSDKLKTFQYSTEVINISKEIISKEFTDSEKEAFKNDEYLRINSSMDKGSALRYKYGDAGILAMAVVNIINSYRKRNNAKTPSPIDKTAFIVKSLKTVDEINLLKSVYGNGFYVFGIFCDERLREEYLKYRGIKDNDKIKSLIQKDQNEANVFGQHTNDTFQLADFFIDYVSGSSEDVAKIHRMIDLIFGSPFLTPTFGEYAMFQAYCSSLRSADLSRQIGAVICKDNEIISTGVNDCPKYEGGLYWPSLKKRDKIFRYEDDENGRDYMRGGDSNKFMFKKIAEDILEKLNLPPTDENIDKIKNTTLGNITEYGRMVHAEMEALSMCARNNISCRDAKMYVTTLPCHNCAKHIIASGIKEVIYIEPYSKSKAIDFYNDSITTNESEKDQKILFAPYFGVGPKKFIDMFSLKNGITYDRVRENKGTGKTIDWELEEKRIRDQMLPTSYIDREASIIDIYIKLIKNNS